MDGHADLVYGSRFPVREASRVLHFYHSMANKGLTFLSNLFTNANMTDPETCYKAARLSVVWRSPAMVFQKPKARCGAEKTLGIAVTATVSSIGGSEYPRKC